VSDFGIPIADVPTCSGGTDIECQVSPFRGGERHTCGPDGRCTGFRLEVRRFHVRPEGLEMVFATNADDPQGPVLVGKMNPLPLVVDDPDAICDPTRLSTDPGGVERIEVGVADLRFFARPYTTGPLCDHDAVGCRAICAEYGTLCREVTALQLEEEGEIPRTSTCNTGCCSPHVLCPTPRGGTQCARVMTDTANCGGCGIVCDAGDSCVGGSCIAP
jgi:hypothetical protein